MSEVTEKKQEQIPSIPDEAKAILDQVETPVGNDTLEEESEGVVITEESYTDEMANDEAQWLVGAVADGVEKFWPMLQYEDSIRLKVAGATAPVFKKYGGVLPPWLAVWKEEIGLAIVLGGVAFQSIRAVRHYNAEVAAQGKKEGQPEGKPGHMGGTDGQT